MNYSAGWVIAGFIIAIPSLIMVALPHITRAEDKHQREIELDRRRYELQTRLLGEDFEQQIREHKTERRLKDGDE